MSDERLKQEKLATNKHLAAEKSAIKNEKNLGKLQTLESRFFIGKIFMVMMVFIICLFINQHLGCWT